MLAVLGCALAASGAATTVYADEAESGRFATSRPSSVTVSVTNLTHATWFAPILVAAHHGAFTGFTEGKPASPALQALAEIGDIAPLAETLRLAMRGTTVSAEFRSGLWTKDVVRSGGTTGEITGSRFFNVRKIGEEGELIDLKLYEFDNDMRLRSLTTAARSLKWTV